MKTPRKKKTSYQKKTPHRYLPMIMITVKGKDLYFTEKQLILLMLLGNFTSNKKLRADAKCRKTTLCHRLTALYEKIGCHAEKICLFHFAVSNDLVLLVNKQWIANWQNSPYLIPENEREQAYKKMKSEPIE